MRCGELMREYQYTQEASSGTAASVTIASGKAMTLRLDGSSKNIGTALYNATTGDIKATKGSTTGNVALVVQGKNGTTDWYYSKKITGTDIVKVSDIESALGLSGIDLSACKIWLETTDSTNSMIYAVDAVQQSITNISSVAITGINTPTVNTLQELHFRQIHFINLRIPQQLK